MSKYNRASLKTRLHFLFTGEIKGYWYTSERMVLTTYVSYLMQNMRKLVPERYSKEQFGHIADFLNNPCIPFAEIKPYVLRFDKGTPRLGRNVDYLPEDL